MSALEYLKRLLVRAGLAEEAFPGPAAAAAPPPPPPEPAAYTSLVPTTTSAPTPTPAQFELANVFAAFYLSAKALIKSLSSVLSGVANAAAALLERLYAAVVHTIDTATTAVMTAASRLLRSAAEAVSFTFGEVQVAKARLMRARRRAAGR